MYTWFHSITSLLVPLLDGIHTVTRDWGLAVIGLTLCVKAALFYFNMLAARQQVRSASMQPKLKELKERLANVPEQLPTEMFKLYRDYRIRPFQSIAALLLQLPVLMGMYGLFLTHGSAMTSILVPWAANLAMADPHHLIPIATAGLSFILALIPLTEAAIQPSLAGMNRWMLALIVALLPLLFMWRSPVALGLYWMTGTLFGLMERGFYRTGWGKRLLAK
ncbi:MAG: YidC/Oxa1 family rane protein insertase [Paenibacillus sp.]|jgi:YidC/Oxa1 family membrane protein insertase|nr:YidC/Oxa1 family rane protein insertase [Paenibacillus sp.]